jgi:hypothetical protein
MSKENNTIEIDTEWLSIILWSIFAISCVVLVLAFLMKLNDIQDHVHEIAELLELQGG